MKTVKQILDTFWIGAAAFGVAGIVLEVMGHHWLSGVMFGAAAVKFISSIKQFK